LQHQSYERRPRWPIRIYSTIGALPKDDPLNLIVEIKGYRREDAKEKKSTMENYWVPGVNNHRHYGRWAFSEFTDIYEMQEDFEKKVEKEFKKMVAPFLSMTAKSG